LDLCLKRHASKRTIYGFAASDAVVIMICAAVGNGVEMLNAGISLGKWLIAEEAKAALEEEQSFEGSCGHRLLTVHISARTLTCQHAGEQR